MQGFEMKRDKPLDLIYHESVAGLVGIAKAVEHQWLAIGGVADSNLSVAVHRLGAGSTHHCDG